MFFLPISGHAVSLRPPGGIEELRLTEASDAGVSTGLTLASSCALLPPDSPAWPDLPLADLHAALLALRRLLEGDDLVSEVRCVSCKEKVDLSFSITGYLQAHAPGKVRGLKAAGDGWFQTGSVVFRLVTVADAIAASGSADPETYLRSVCVRTGSANRAEAAMRKIAPLLSGELAGQCPECRSAVTVWFDPVAFVLAELRDRAAAVYRDVHLLASVYGWSESQILQLPRLRRERYVEMIDASGGPA